MLKNRSLSSRNRYYRAGKGKVRAGRISVERLCKFPQQGLPVEEPSEEMGQHQSLSRKYSYLLILTLRSKIPNEANVRGSLKNTGCKDHWMSQKKFKGFLVQLSHFADEDGKTYKDE